MRKISRIITNKKLKVIYARNLGHFINCRTHELLMFWRIRKIMTLKKYHDG